MHAQTHTHTLSNVSSLLVAALCTSHVSGTASRQAQLIHRHRISFNSIQFTCSCAGQRTRQLQAKHSLQSLQCFCASRSHTSSCKMHALVLARQVNDILQHGTAEALWLRVESRKAPGWCQMPPLPGRVHPETQTIYIRQILYIYTVHISTMRSVFAKRSKKSRWQLAPAFISDSWSPSRVLGDRLCNGLSCCLMQCTPSCDSPARSLGQEGSLDNIFCLQSIFSVILKLARKSMKVSKRKNGRCLH